MFLDGNNHVALVSHHDNVFFEILVKKIAIFEYW